MPDYTYNVSAAILQGGTFASRGTPGNFGLGTFVATSGVATVQTGLASLTGVVLTPIGGPSGAGSFTGARWIAAPGTAGAFVAYGLVGTIAQTTDGTFAYYAFGV